MPPAAAASAGSWSRGVGHSTASPANDATSTIAAAQPNSHSGIGRLCAGRARGPRRPPGARSSAAAGAAATPAAPAAHSAVWSARSKASRPKEPSSRAVIRPSLSTTNSHGSVCRLYAAAAAAGPWRVVVRVDLLVDEVHLVAVLRLSWSATSTTGPQTRDWQSCGVANRSATGFLPTHVGERLAVHVAGRRRACRSARRRRRRRRPCRSSTFGACSPTSGILSLRRRDHRSWPGRRDGLAVDQRDRHHRVLARLAERHLRRVDRGERVRPRWRPAASGRGVGHEHVGGRDDTARAPSWRASRRTARSCRRGSRPCLSITPNATPVALAGEEDRAGHAHLRAAADLVRPAAAASCRRWRGTRWPRGPGASRTFACSPPPVGIWATGSLDTPLPPLPQPATNAAAAASAATTGRARIRPPRVRGEGRAGRVKWRSVTVGHRIGS